MAYNWDAVNAAIRAGRAERKWSQEELAKRTDGVVSLGTVKNLEGGRDYKRIPVEALRAVDAAFDWPAGTLEAKLDPTAPAPNLEARYQNRESVTDAGRTVSTVEDALYNFFMAGAPDTTLADFDRVRRRVFEVLQEEGIAIAKRHDETSSGTDPDE